MESLLPYYERELTFLRRLSNDFARRYPKVAGRLLLSGETCEDPHIERLIESFAFLAGRIHKKLDDDFPEVTDSLLQVVYPQYLRPFPSVSIAHFDCGPAAAQLTKAACIDRHTLLHTRPVRGVSCRFRTAYETELWPLRIAGAAYENMFDTAGLRADLARTTAAAIRIDLETLSDAAGFDALGVGKLRFFLNGEPSLTALLRESLLSGTTGIWVSVPHAQDKIELAANTIQAVGFAADDGLLEQDARTHRAYQLLLEYFVYPEKFNFFDLDLGGLAGRLPPRTRRLEIRVGLRHAAQAGGAGNLLDRTGKDNFVLGCTPVVNLFSQAPEPIRMTNMAVAYPLIVDSRRPQAYEVYDIRRVFQVQQNQDGEEIREFRPFYSIRHGEAHDGPACYWHASYADEGAADSYTMELSLVDARLDMLQPQTNTLSLELTCTNRDLPAQLPFGLAEGDLFIEGGSVAKAVRLLRKPTPSYRFPRGRGAQWRLISHLSLNHLSLSGQGVEAIREILALYDITRSGTNSRQIGGIVAIDNRPAMARMAGNPFPAFVRGLEIRVTVDESHYAGIGLFMFAQVLDHFFGLYAHANSFTQLVMVSKQSGQELIKCQPRSGESILA
ncbi:MAG TPA: type VI secretion system baseplate subunit TssF [Noviherbaspirillum sp.]|nr:type VI secretion system baseplate subunit TssF [Noviherbaspirillum sp.]